MARSLTASDIGLQLVNDRREKLGWNRTDDRFLAAAGDISRATLNRFYNKQPIKHDNFVAICAAVGIKNWQRVADRVLSSEQPRVEVVAEIPATPLKELDRELQSWFVALRYEIEENSRLETETYFEWIIRIPMRSRFDRVLIHGIAGEPTMQDLARVEQIVREKNLDEGHIVTDYRVGSSVTAYLGEEKKKGNFKISCLTVDELIDLDVDFSPYIQWLEGEIGVLGIERDYLELDCSKPEKDSRTGKYLPPRVDIAGAEKIDRYMDDWLSSTQTNHISILGEFGTGKTWFALHYAWEGIKAYQWAKRERKKRPRLPLFITLRDYAKALKVDTVIAGFFFVNHNIRLNGDVFDRLNRMGKLLIIFDGFDEMANRIDGVQKITDNFWALAEVITENSKIILTCRTEHFPTNDTSNRILQGQELASTKARVSVAPKFETLNLHPFSIEQIKAVLTNRQATVETIDRILKHPQLFDLVKRPVMVDLVLAALPEINADKTVDLARVFLYALKHKLAQDIKTERTFTSMADKLFFLCEVSWAMLSQNELTLHYSQFPERLRDVFGDAIEDRHRDHWHYDMAGQTILTRDHEGNYRPAHKSLLEFFVAYKLAAELGLLHPDFLDLLREPVEAREVAIVAPENPPKSPLGRGTSEHELVGCKWSDYWRLYRQGAEIHRFQQEEMDKLVATFGKSPLIPAVMKLLLPMLDLQVNYRQTNPLLELMQWTRGKSREQAGWLGSNAGNALVKLNPYGLEDRDLSGLVLPNIDLAEAGLQGVNLTGADLTNALMIKNFSICNAIATSLDGQFFFTGHDDGKVTIWGKDGTELFTFNHQDSVNALAVNDNWLFSGSNDGEIRQWDLKKRQVVGLFRKDSESLKSLVMHKNWLFSSSRNGEIRRQDIETKELITFTGHQKSVNSLVMHGDSLFSASDDHTVKQWDLTTGQCIQTLKHDSSVTALAVSGNSLFSASRDGKLRQWSLTKWKCIEILEHNSSVNALAVSGNWLFSASGNSQIEQWQISDDEKLTIYQTFTEHQDSVLSLAANDNYLFSGSWDNTVKQWEFDRQESIRTFSGYTSWVYSVAIDDKRLFSGDFDGTIRQWDIDTGECLNSFRSDISVVSMVVSGNYLFCRGGNNTVKQWEIGTGKLIHPFKRHTSAIGGLAISGNCLFSGSYDKTVKQWDIGTGEWIRTFSHPDRGHQNGIRGLIVTGGYLFSSSEDYTVKQWRVETGELIHTFNDHQNNVWALAVSKEDNPYLFSGSHDKTIKKWEIETGKLIYTFEGHEGAVTSIVIHDKYLFSSSYDKTIKKWHIQTGELIDTFEGHERAVLSIVVCGEWLFSGSYDQTIKKWNIQTGECVRTFSNALCAGAMIGDVRGLTLAQIDSLTALGAAKFVKILDATKNIIATAHVRLEGSYYAGEIDFDRMPEALMSRFEEYEYFVNNQMLSHVDNLEREIESNSFAAIFEDGRKSSINDLQIFPSTRSISFRILD